MLTPRFYRAPLFNSIASNVPAVRFDVARHRTAAQGGPMGADIDASGGEDELLALFNLLGYGIELVTPEGDNA